jgi:sulfite reductase alpha subunit-like flavoprotein
MSAQFEIDATQPLAEPVHRGARNRKAALILLSVGAACYVWGRNDGYARGEFEMGAMVANSLPRMADLHAPAARVADPIMMSRGGEPKANANAVADGPTSRPWEQGWSKKGEGKQDFLEASPYHSKAAVPTNTFSPKAPYVGKVVSVDRMVGPDATGETCHIVIDHGGNMPYYEGQSFGVVAPLIDQKNGKPAKTRLYSIASSRYGDDMTGNTASLCVRRATYWCPEMKAEDPAKKGVCSNWLCDAKPGDEIQLTGPTGKVMLMP